jgi:probable phosphoglycerate mutase
MTEILLIRHGETEWNAVRRLQGHLDVALNAEGERQAAALGQALLDEPLDVIVASDLQRAMQTAQAIAQPRGMIVQVDPGLRERCYGAFEGVMYSEIAERFPEAYAAWQARDIDARFPPGERQAETLREFHDRAIDTITRLAELHNHTKIALVTHGGVLECAYRAAKGVGLLSPRDFDIFNASINRIVWDGATLHVTEWSNIAHLTQTALDEVDK